MIAGFINYSNSYPFLKAVREKSIANLNIECHYPAKLNDKLSKGELDSSAISLFEYLLHQDQYMLMPDWCINSRGHVRSVLLYSKCPFDELEGKNILLSPESATSNNLLKLLLHHKSLSPNQIKVRDPEDELSHWDGVLLIGDSALTFKSDHHGYVTDLAEQWVDWTEGPVVFGVHAIRKDRLNENKIPLQELTQCHLEVQQRLQNDLESVCSEIKQAYPEMSTDFIDYFKCLDFNLDQPCQKAIQRYADESVAIGSLTHSQPLQFAEF